MVAHLVFLVTDLIVLEVVNFAVVLMKVLVAIACLDIDPIATLMVLIDGEKIALT
jgi:hypothetical protein